MGGGGPHKNERCRARVRSGVCPSAVKPADVVTVFVRRPESSTRRFVVTPHISRQVWRDQKDLTHPAAPYLPQLCHRDRKGGVAVSEGVADDMSRLARLRRDLICVSPRAQPFYRVHQ
jgi:hypothetical protein